MCTPCSKGTSSNIHPVMDQWVTTVKQNPSCVAMSMMFQVSDVTAVWKQAESLFSKIRQIIYCLKFSFACAVI